VRRLTPPALPPDACTSDSLPSPRTHSLPPSPRTVDIQIVGHSADAVVIFASSPAAAARLGAMADSVRETELWRAPKYLIVPKPRRGARNTRDAEWARNACRRGDFAGWSEDLAPAINDLVERMFSAPVRVVTKSMQKPKRRRSKHSAKEVLQLRATGIGKPKPWRHRRDAHGNSHIPETWERETIRRVAYCSVM
jgi:hypothetical protein